MYSAGAGWGSEMALDTYAALQTSIASFLNRTDLTSAIPDFVTLAEAQIRRRINRAWKDGKTLPRAMVTSASFSITAETAAQPSDFIGVVAFTIDSQAVKLSYLSPTAFEREKALRGPSQVSATPQYFTIIGSNFKFLPTPDVTYSGTLEYWQKFTALSSGVNWILTTHPDVYLYGSLAQSAPYLMDDARIQLWGGLFATAIDDLLNSDPSPANESVLRADGGLTPHRYGNAWDITTDTFR